MVVEIYEYNPTWRDEFKRIGSSLRNTLGDIACRLDHSGSTKLIRRADSWAAKTGWEVGVSDP